MLLIVNAKGQYWDGQQWSQQGRTFLTVSAATRSLHEEGEDLVDAQILEIPRAAS